MKNAALSSEIDLDSQFDKLQRMQHQLQHFQQSILVKSQSHVACPQNQVARMHFVDVWLRIPFLKNVQVSVQIVSHKQFKSTCNKPRCINTTRIIVMVSP
ncbi:hypothetical protein CIPAW_03G138000 [Carya illinoinensis]|uniref:Uncharacterized protein n=1 Tax=Carya illinoinensis TaxID=32201 RepID=A0A8T1R3G9_CARIL|nr:hypothetical protein CIPAW_03G138000 [Carya illinoinensis]